MTKRTRLFLAVASGILVVGLGTGLVAAYVGGFQNLTADRGGWARRTRLRSRRRARRRLRRCPRRHGFRAAPQAFGSSSRGPTTAPSISKNRPASISRPTSTTSSRRRPGWAIRRRESRRWCWRKGRFDEVRIEGLIRDQGGAVEDYKGSRLLVSREKKLAARVSRARARRDWWPRTPFAGRSTPRRAAQTSRQRRSDAPCS